MPFTRRGIRGRLGATSASFVAMAVPAPLLVVTALLPAMIGLAGEGLLIAIAASTLIALAFCPGFAALSRQIRRQGGSYAYVAAVLGTRTGVGSAAVAVFTYALLLFATCAVFGFHAREFFKGLGFALPWYSFAFAGVLIAGVLAYKRVEVSARTIALVVGFQLALVLFVSVRVFVDRWPFVVPAGALDAPFVEAGGFPLAVMLAFVCFGGLTSCAAYREELREPVRTIPRATFAAVGTLGLLYLLTVAAMLVGQGAPRGEKAPRSEGVSGAFADLATEHSGAGITTLIAGLTVFAAFAMLLALHNLVTRYLYSLGRDRVLAASLGAAHPERRSPYRASSYVTVLELSSVLLVGMITDLKADGAAAYALAIRAIGVGAIGIVGLLTLTSLAVLVYFIRNRPAAVAEGVWRAAIAPGLAVAGMCTVFAFSWSNVEALIGAGAVASALIALLVPIAFAAGCVYANVLRARRPQVFARVGGE